MGWCVPDNMASENQWALWKLDNSGMKKLPMTYKDGELKMAKVNKPEDWGSLSDAINVLENVDDFGGLGFLIRNSYILIDMDDCVDLATGKMAPRAERICKLFAGNYMEYSQSGTGIHIITKGHIPYPRRKQGIEIYNASRFVAFTGDAFDSSEPRDSTKELRILYERCNLFIEKANKMSPPSGEHGDCDDDDILATIRRGKNAKNFEKLWVGDFEDDYPSQSEADFRMACLLWYYSGDKDQVFRLFMRSALGKRRKAVKRYDYVHRTIDKAIQGETLGLGKNSNGRVTHMNPMDMLQPVEEWDEEPEPRRIVYYLTENRPSYIPFVDWHDPVSVENAALNMKYWLENEEIYSENIPHALDAFWAELAKFQATKDRNTARRRAKRAAEKAAREREAQELAAKIQAALSPAPENDDIISDPGIEDVPAVVSALIQTPAKKKTAKKIKKKRQPRLKQTKRVRRTKMNTELKNRRQMIRQRLRSQNHAKNPLTHTVKIPVMRSVRLHTMSVHTASFPHKITLRRNLAIPIRAQAQGPPG